MTSLSAKACKPCREGDSPLSQADAQPLLEQLRSGWRLDGAGHLVREYKFPDFVHALKFANLVGEIAENEGHHPEITLGWGHLGIELWTHAVGGLSENDFILAAKIDGVDGDV